MDTRTNCIDPDETAHNKLSQQDLEFAMVEIRLSKQRLTKLADDICKRCMHMQKLVNLFRLCK